MFVHDFVHVDRPLGAIVGHFGPLADPWLGALVVAAWNDISEDWAAAGIDPTELAVGAGLRVKLGLPRFRDDGLIVPISWPPGDRRFVPGLEADLELASFGPDRTHIQLLGRYRFPAGVDRFTREGSLAHRITVAGVRRFLELLANQLEHGSLVEPDAGDAAAATASMRDSAAPARPAIIGTISVSRRQRTRIATTRFDGGEMPVDSDGRQEPPIA
ncbi:MAG: hypothetical protein KDB21_20840 [Acidimicrobiales bacterium]|nr:hypothetical protein [Acidimicrobiales bacterium]